MNIEQVILEATRRLVEQFHPQAVILFGSQARGTADARSDVDLLVIHEFEAPAERWKLGLAMDRALRGFDPPFACDLIVLSPQEFEEGKTVIGSIAWPAAREGRVLYDRAADLVLERGVKALDVEGVHV